MGGVEIFDTSFRGVRRHLLTADGKKPPEEKNLSKFDFAKAEHHASDLAGLLLRTDNILNRLLPAGVWGYKYIGPKSKMRK